MTSVQIVGALEQANRARREPDAWLDLQRIEADDPKARARMAGGFETAERLQHQQLRDSPRARRPVNELFEKPAIDPSDGRRDQISLDRSVQDRGEVAPPLRVHEGVRGHETPAELKQRHRPPLAQDAQKLAPTARQVGCRELDHARARPERLVARRPDAFGMIASRSDVALEIHPGLLAQAQDLKTLAREHGQDRPALNGHEHRRIDLGVNGPLAPGRGHSLVVDLASRSYRVGWRQRLERDDAYSARDLIGEYPS